MTTRRAFLTACAAAAQLPAVDRPAVIRFDFDKEWHNQGAWGGELRPEGACRVVDGAADLTGGGKVVFEDPRLSALDSFSAAVSFFPRSLIGTAILLARPNQWQIRLDPSGKLSVSTYYSPNHAQSSDVTQISELDSWYQLGISFDRAASRLHFAFRQVGAPDSIAAGGFKMVKPTLGPSVPKTAVLEAGRFSGLLDNLQLFDYAQSPSQLQQLLEKAAPSPVHTGLDHLSQFVLPMESDRTALLPSRAEVEMSSRWWHPDKPGDPHDTMADLAAFGATRLEWIYDTDVSHIRRVTGAGIACCATINASDNTPGRPYSGCDFDGNLAVFSWMVSWIQKDGKPTGAACVNNERFRERNAQTIRSVVAAGASGVQYDDWASNLSFASGECFCEFCRKRFSAYLPDAPSNYRDYLKSTKGVPDVQAYLKYRKQNASDPLQRAYVRFQAESVRDNLTALKVILKSHARSDGRHPALSVNGNFNSTSQQSKSFTAAGIPDYFIGEGGDETLAGIFLNAKIAESLHRMSVFSPFPYHVDKTRVEIALQYALGQLCLAPYDVWMHSSDVPRHFANPAGYRDLFAFVREHRDLLAGCETVATLAIVVDSSKPDDARLRPILGTLIGKHVPWVLVLTGKDHFEPRVSPVWAQRIRHIIDLTDGHAATNARIWGPEIGGALLRQTSVLHVEPENVVATIRATPDGKTIAIHLVNRNFDEFSRAAFVESFGVQLMQSDFWGDFTQVELMAPGEKSQMLACQSFGRDRRLVVPQLKTWAILRIVSGPTANSRTKLTILR